MKYLQKRFSVGYTSKEYEENYERIFGKRKLLIKEEDTNNEKEEKERKIHSNT